MIEHDRTLSLEDRDMEILASFPEPPGLLDCRELASEMGLTTKAMAWSLRRMKNAGYDIRVFRNDSGGFDAMIVASGYETARRHADAYWKRKHTNGQISK